MGRAKSLGAWLYGLGDLWFGGGLPVGEAGSLSSCLLDLRSPGTDDDLLVDG